MNARAFINGVVTANAISITGALLSVAAGLCLAMGLPIAVAAVLFSVGALCDVADGTYADARCQADPRIGAMVDSVSDKVGEIALLLGLGLRVSGGFEKNLVMIVLGLGLGTSLLKALSGEHGLGLGWGEARVFGRALRASLLSAILLFEAFAPTSIDWLTYGLIALVAFNAITISWRGYRVVGRLRALRADPDSARVDLGRSSGSAPTGAAAAPRHRAGAHARSPLLQDARR